MEVAKLILEYLKVFVYPGTIFIILWIFRKQIKALLTGQLTAKFKELTITIEKQKEMIQTITKVTEIASEEIEKEINSLNDNKHLDPIKRKISDMLSVVKFDHYERLVLLHLKEKHGKANLSKMVAQMENEFDPWRVDKDLGYIMNAINSLEKKGVLIREKDNMLVAHKSILELLN